MTQNTNELVSLTSEWVGDSYLRVRTRRVGRSGTLMVDVAEYAARPSKKRALDIARKAARQSSATPLRGATGSVIFEHETVKATNKLDPEGNVTPIRTRVRNTTFAFGI
ncbi:hypothetical protein SEA_Phreeze_49 [Mycobacterium phage Phreeze]|nr:hypothetical protein SEA_Phreeze_49 [Mycobacterium phage Phreeze]